MENDGDKVIAICQANLNDPSKGRGISGVEHVRRCGNELSDDAVSIKIEVADDEYERCAIFHNPVQSNHMYTASEIKERKVTSSDELNTDSKTDCGSDSSESEEDEVMVKYRDKGDLDFVLTEPGKKRGPYSKKHHKAKVDHSCDKNNADTSHKTWTLKKGLKVKFVKERKKRQQAKLGKGFFRLDDQKGSVLSKQFQSYLEVVHEEDVSPVKDQEQVTLKNRALYSALQSCEVNNKVDNHDTTESLRMKGGKQSPTCARDTYRCKVCGVTSKSLSSIRYHIRRVELYDPSMCSECGEMLPNKSQLAYHKRLTHNNTFVLKKYRCSYEDCSVTNKSPSEIQKHMATVHENRRDYPCMWEGCGKCFKDGYALKVHMRIHNNDKPIVCYLCGFQCRQKASLNWHMKTKHPADTQASANHK